MIPSCRAGSPIPPEWWRAGLPAGRGRSGDRPSKTNSSLLAVQKLEHLLGLMLSLFFVMIDHLTRAVDEVGLARRHRTGAVLAESLDDRLVGVREQREGEVVHFLELLLLF